MGDFKLTIIASAVIAGLAIYKWLKGWKARKIYESYIKDIEENSFTEDGQLRIGYFSKKELNEITTKFIDSAKKETININTEVIIEEGIDGSLKDIESKAESGSSQVIAIGLLGTFIGLVLAIDGVGEMLNSNMTMEGFIAGMKQPIASMSLAFLTTIAGVGGSLWINSNNRKLNLTKEKFFNMMENYLDNNIVSLYQKDELSKLSSTLEKQFTKMTDTVEDSMKALVSEMNTLFTDGVEKLTENIQENNLNLTSSVEALEDYSVSLGRLAKELGSIINSFNEPVEKFNQTVTEYVCENKEFSEELRKTMTKFGEEVARTEESFTTLRDVIKLNKDETKTLKNILSEEFTATSEAKSELSRVVQQLTKSTDNQTEEMTVKLNAISEAYKRLNDYLLNIEEMKKETRRESVKATKEAVEESNERLKREVVTEIKEPIESFEISVKEFTNRADVFIKMQTSSNELIQHMKKTEEIKVEKQKSSNRDNMSMKKLEDGIEIKNQIDSKEFTEGLEKSKNNELIHN